MQATQPVVVETVFRKLGGREVLGQKVTSEADLARLRRELAAAPSMRPRVARRALRYIPSGEAAIVRYHRRPNSTVRRKMTTSHLIEMLESMRFVIGSQCLVRASHVTILPSTQCTVGPFDGSLNP